MLKPSDYGLPHNDWRPYQLDTVRWVENVKDNVAKITEQPTGSGKSALAMAQGAKGRKVAVLTKTKNLQVQYENGDYNATIVYGKQNYPCLHKLLPQTATAEDCKYPKKMRNCDIAQDGACSYFNKMENASRSNRLVLNYALWFTTHQKWNTDYLIMDEAHNVSEMVLNHVGFEMSEKTRQRMEFPEFPIIKEPSRFIGAIKESSGFDDVIEWVGEVHSIVLSRINRLDGMRATTEFELAKLRVLKNYQMKMEHLRETLVNANTDHWFLRSGPNGQNGQAGILCKPITARYNTKDFFCKPRMMFMSATIGDVSAFTAELGIEKYETRIVDSVWPIHTRPVYSLPVPSMGKSATEKDPKAFDKQADEIAKAIKDCPNEWSGFILVTRKSEAGLLAERLGRRGLADRVWITPGYDGEYSPTDEQVRAWGERKKQKPNSICITWAFWEGVDGLSEKICIIAKAPFVMETEYERARRSFDSKFYLQRAAYTLEQGLGRTRRGNPEDYDDPEHDIQRGLVCIADASWKRLKPYMSKAIQEAIVEL